VWYGSVFCYCLRLLLLAVWTINLVDLSLSRGEMPVFVCMLWCGGPLRVPPCLPSHCPSRLQQYRIGVWTNRQREDAHHVRQSRCLGARPAWCHPSGRVTGGWVCRWSVERLCRYRDSDHFHVCMYVYVAWPRYLCHPSTAHPSSH
jgi:hypothetical protein